MPSANSAPVPAGKKPLGKQLTWSAAGIAGLNSPVEEGFLARGDRVAENAQEVLGIGPSAINIIYCDLLGSARR
jgi:hypothetical protein